MPRLQPKGAIEVLHGANPIAIPAMPEGIPPRARAKAVKTHVLAASTLMTFCEDRPGAETIEGLLAKAAEIKHPLLMSVVNWGEVYYSVWRARGEKQAREKLKEIAQLPIEIVGVDIELARMAATLKAKHRLPYADCFAGALAQARKAALVTTDRDFELLGGLVKTVWL